MDGLLRPECLGPQLFLGNFRATKMVFSQKNKLMESTFLHKDAQRNIDGVGRGAIC